MNQKRVPAIRDVQRDDEGRALLWSMTFEELTDWVQTELGEKPFRAKQLWKWLYIRLVGDFDEMTDLSKSVRAKLKEKARIDVLKLEDVYTSADGTRKLTWTTLAGATIESVLIPTEDRNTLCISSQVGCAMNCQFCLTARMGLRGQLTTAEIVGQVIGTRRLYEEEQHLSNIVFMGMGEPLHNPDNVIPATRVLINRDGLNFSKRKVTVSTSGLVPEIERFGEESEAQLAVSLNATSDEVRDWIMPINRRYNLDKLLGTLRSYPYRKHERVTFEYVMLDGVNDTEDDFRRLVRIASSIPCKVNLIPFNPHPGTEFTPSPMSRVESFRERLQAKHIHATIRTTRGDDEMAACGQLGKPGPKQPKRMRPPESFAESIQPSPVAEDSVR